MAQLKDTQVQGNLNVTGKITSPNLSVSGDINVSGTLIGGGQE